MADFAVLVAPLASALALEYLHLNTNKCSFKISAPSTQLLEINCKSVKCKGSEARQLQRDLSDVVRIPSTAVLDIVLYSDHRRAAEASLVSALLHAHSDYDQPHPHKTIQALELGAIRDKGTIFIQAWRSAGDLPVHYENTAGFINMTLLLPAPEVRAMDSEMLLLCQSIELNSLCHLRLSSARDDCGNGWSKDTWYKLFMPANGVKSVHVTGAFPNLFFEVLAAPVGAAKSTPTQKGPRKQRRQLRSLFPSLSHVVLSHIDLEDACLEDCFHNRARHTPVDTLTIRECSIRDTTVEELRGVKELEVDWDESHGGYSEREFPYCDNCDGRGCPICLGSDWNSESSG